MGIIRLSSKIQKVLTNDRMVTRNVRYSTIGSDLIIARCAQVANVKPATVRSGILGLKEAGCALLRSERPPCEPRQTGHPAP